MTEDIGSILEVKPKSSERSALSLNDLESMTADEKISHIIERLQKIENRLPNSDIINPRFWTRAWTVFGYGFVTSLVIYGIVFAIVLLLGLLNAIGR